MAAKGTRTPSYWYDGSTIPFPARLLAPVYGAVIALRRLAYRRRWLKRQALPVPVIVVGNVTAGGTGKTPLTIALVNRLREAGWKPGVASRGYGREEPGVARWVDAGTAESYFKAFYAVLKPGGTLGVADHRAKPGTDLQKMKDSGYLTEALVIKLATDAGFKLDAKSEINANPKDAADHPNGVWTLPPTNRHDAADDAKYKTIGESDRMTLRFVKP